VRKGDANLFYVPNARSHPCLIAMLSSTASLKGDVAPGSIFDFSPAAEAAKELPEKEIAQHRSPAEWPCGLRTSVFR
jgi:hypothetical protein